jgi:hypothetical protein
MLCVSAAGITRQWIRPRTIRAEDVRRVHVYIDFDGEPGVVVRSGLWRFVHLGRHELADPVVAAGIRSLVDRVRDRARVDPEVDSLMIDVA